MRVPKDRGRAGKRVKSAGEKCRSSPELIDQKKLSRPGKTMGPENQAETLTGLEAVELAGAELPSC